jgi:hypothetical protein
MRQIKFKAKRLDGKGWIEGTPICINGKPYGIMIGEKESPDIAPSTICQFTGLKDCKGNEIWENDVIELRTGIQLIVMWDTNSCRFSLHKRGCGDVTFPFCKTTAKDFKVIKSKFDKEK